MSIYNISNPTSTTNLRAVWSTGNQRSSIVDKPQPYVSQSKLCTNFFSINSQACDVRLPNDRFVALGLIKSSKQNAVSNNNNLPDPFANFEGSYFDKINLAIYWKPINN